MSDILSGLFLWLCLACSFGALSYLLMCDDNEPIEEDERAPCPDDPEYLTWLRNTRDPHEHDPLW